MAHKSCRKCRCTSLYVTPKGNNIGLYCSKCGAYQKWVSKSEAKNYEYRESGLDITISTTGGTHSSSGSYNESNSVKNKDIESRLEDLRKSIDKEIDAEMEKLPKTKDDNIRKNAYCFALQKILVSIDNILVGRAHDDAG